MKVIIDRFEGDMAVVELPDMSFLNVPRTLFPGAKESDVIEVSIDNTETEKRKKKITSLMDELFKD